MEFAPFLPDSTGSTFEGYGRRTGPSVPEDVPPGALCWFRRLTIAPGADGLLQAVRHESVVWRRHGSRREQVAAGAAFLVMAAVTRAVPAAALLS